MMLLGALILGRPPFVFVDGLAKSTPAEASLFGSGYAGLGTVPVGGSWPLRNLCTSHEHHERRYVPLLIRPSGTFSHREKALTTLSLSHRERVARSAG